MTDTELKTEWDYIYTERLSILCEDRDPTPEQVRIARTEADHHIAALRAQSASTNPDSPLAGSNEDCLLL